MHRFSTCPKCKGMVVLESDQFGWYQLCLQCGFLRDLGTMVLVHKPASDSSKVPEPAHAASGRQEGRSPNSRRGG